VSEQLLRCPKCGGEMSAGFIIDDVAGLKRRTDSVWIEGEKPTWSVVWGYQARPNEQTPHEQDEVYIVVQGRGVLFHDGKRDRFESGDFLFVAAATEHRFEDFSDDLLVWRVFYGPKGGEVLA